MRKVIISTLVVVILLSSIVSATLVTDIFSKITGKISYNPRCSDSDNGKDFAKRGKAQDGKGGGGIDYCTGEILKEHYCNLDTLEVESIENDCSLEGSCKNGECIIKESISEGSELDNKNTILLLTGELMDFGSDNLLVTAYASGEADLTYTKTVRVKDGEVITLGENRYRVALGKNVELTNLGKRQNEIIEKEVEKIVYVKNLPIKEQSKKVSFWKKLFS